MNILMSDEANREIEEFLNSPKAMVDSSQKLVYGAGSGRLLKMNFFNMTYHQLPNQNN